MLVKELQAANPGLIIENSFRFFPSLCHPLPSAAVTV